MSEINGDVAPNLSRLLEIQLAVTPDQQKFLRRRFEGLTASEIASLEELAGHMSALISGAETQYAEDYGWICNTMLEEELFFRRHGHYRLSTFEDAFREVYSRKEYMSHYMNGLLMTQLWWSNHSQCMSFYQDRFLATNRPGYTHLEIGPGHGLFLYLAAADSQARSVRGWEISEASLAVTREALGRLGLSNLPTLELQNFLDGATGHFDSVVFSEVLEHMEHPREALLKLRNLLEPGGRLFLNIPINSPAPDHLFNPETTEGLERFVGEAGFNILDRAYFPATNQTLDAARKKNLTISCALIVTRAD